MAYNYDDAFIRERVDSGKDSRRAKTADELAAKARAGDQAALLQLEYLSGVKDNPATPEVEGWATMDAKNYGRMMLRDLGVLSDPSYGKAHDGGGFLGSVGGVVKTVAPIAAMAIPGLGPVAAGAIAAGGHAVGSKLQGDGWDLGGSIKSGLIGAGGNMLLGGQGVGGIKGIPGRLGIGGSTGVPGAAGTATDVAGAGGGGGILGTGIDLGDIKKYAPLVIGGLGAINAGKQASAASNMRNEAIDMALADYQSRAPLRTEVMNRAMAPIAGPPDLSAQFADTTNPFFRPLPRPQLRAA